MVPVRLVNALQLILVNRYWVGNGLTVPMRKVILSIFEPVNGLVQMFILYARID